MSKKKGQVGLNNLPSIFIILLVIVVVAGLVLQFLSDQKADFTAGSAAANATTKMEEGVTKVTNKFPTIGLVIAAVVVIGLVYAGFKMQR